MSKRREPTPFGRYIMDLMISADLQRQVDLARAAGTTESTISRLIYSPGIPDSDTLRKIAQPLRVSHSDLLLRAHDAEPDSGVPQRPVPTLHPLAIEINRMLADGSPLDPADREALAVILDRLIQPYRAQMRRRTTSAS
jgi:transcriptional regulator with XRE-family HTH domain